MMLPVHKPLPLPPEKKISISLVVILFISILQFSLFFVQNSDIILTQ